MGSNKRMVLFVSFLLAAFLVYPPAVQADMPAYMEAEGQTQGKIQGSCTLQGREGTIVVHSFGHNIHVSYDQQSGSATSRRIHTPFEILKEFDKSSPLLYRALSNGEHLKTVRIKFYRMSPTQREENYFTITLQDAMIVKIAPSSTTFSKESGGLKPMEIVSFTYRKIEWRWEDGSIMSEDDWAEPRL